ncbi:MAG: Xaa-Pro peptidase family protein [Dehalococcoidia bacterium]|jgi:Xaa-Pro aminopeptidase
MIQRLNKIRQHIADNGLDALFVSQAENRRYLSGFTGSSGYLFITQTEAVLATDFRYIEQARGQAPDFKIFQTQGAISKWFNELTSSLSAKKIGFDANDISFSTYRSVTADIRGKELIPTEGLVESLRAVKDADELALMIKAIKVCDAAFEQVASKMRTGMTESEVAWEVEKTMRENGSGVLPFNIIVASGPNAAKPHHQPTSRPIAAGEPVIIDMGASIEGYTSDLSRTICLGKQDEKFGKIYDLVLGAQLTAIATVASGMTGDIADSLARTVIEQGGYGDNFGHGLGHGVGLATHEAPRVGKESKDILTDGMVFTIEPGIYISGWGGVRIEDIIVLKDGRAKVLSKAKKID